MPDHPGLKAEGPQNKKGMKTRIYKTDKNGFCSVNISGKHPMGKVS